MTRALVLISWDGHGPALAYLARDADPAFDIALFDYSGGAAVPETDFAIMTVLRGKTECKGQIFKAFHRFLAESGADYDYVALIDDDIGVAVSALDEAITIAAGAQLDSFSLALTPDSHVNHQRFVQQPGSAMRPVPWVEVMMPFYRLDLYLAAGPFFEETISSYGVDQFAMPLVCQMTGRSQVALIDARAAQHLRPVTSDARVFSNGLTAHQERIILREKCLMTVRRDRPELVGTAWFYRIFAPLNGPGRFWLLYLGWPWHQIERLVSRLVNRQRSVSAGDGPK